MTRPMATGRKPIPKPRFFVTQAAWRKWLAANHEKRKDLWVGFWRVATRRPCITWPQSVDEALCFGWIDGLRLGLDPESYAIRFSPRKPGSKWSQVNLKRFDELDALGLVRAAGKAARANWRGTRAGYSYETQGAGLDPELRVRLEANSRARRFWEAQTPSYRKTCGNWVTLAKRAETRASRFATLVDCCVRGVPIPPLKWLKVKQP